MKESMSSQEKLNIVSLLGSILILTIYSLFVYNGYIKAQPEIINDFSFWGWSFLILIPVSIVAQIIIHIIFAIVNKIVTNEDIDSFSDERDKFIELRSIRIAHWVFISGFFLAMGLVAFKMPIWMMFRTLIFSGFIASVASGIAKIYYYRKGF